MSPHKELIAILGMGAVTFGIRALPFLKVVPLAVLKKLESKQRIFPTMFLSLLVVYCLSPVKTSPSAESIKLVSCAALVALLQWFKGSLILSLGLGTALYLYLVNG